MGCAEDDIDGVWAGFDNRRHGIDHRLDAFARRQQTERQNDGLAAEAELGLRVMGLEKRKVGDAVRDHLDLLWRHVMHGPEKLAAFFCHDDHLGRLGDDLAHDVVLSRRRCREHRMQRRDDRHGEALQELDDVSTGLAAENPVLMLKAKQRRTALCSENRRLRHRHRSSPPGSGSARPLDSRKRRQDRSWQRRRSPDSGGPSRSPDADHA